MDHYAVWGFVVFDKEFLNSLFCYLEAFSSSNVVCVDEDCKRRFCEKSGVFRNEVKRMQCNLYDKKLCCCIELEYDSNCFDVVKFFHRIGVDNIEKISVSQGCDKNPFDGERVDFLNGGFDNTLLSSFVFIKNNAPVPSKESHFFVDLLSTFTDYPLAGPCGSTFGSCGSFIYYDKKTNEKYFSFSRNVKEAWRQYKYMKNDFRNGNNTSGNKRSLPAVRGFSHSKRVKKE